jgi:type II secretory pathway component GspD/PulD (secretin)
LTGYTQDKSAPGSPPYGVNAVSDARNNNVVVTAPAEAMKVVEKIIHEADRPPTIVVSAKALAAGDPKLNVVIQKGDTIIARGSSRSDP